MNLINDQWIPVRRADDTIIKIAPWEITKNIHDNQSKIVAIASPRPDFDGALTQFLIGLLQTACTPETEDAWWDWRENPPKPEELQNHFVPFAACFKMDGDAPRFMQDYQPEELSETSRIAALLIETPGENTLKKGADHFIKRDTVKQLCADCAAIALYTLQLNAPAGGQGNRTGLRGGGPLTTLVLGESLWETSWLNVLVKSNYMSNTTNDSDNDSAKRFPWLAPTRKSNPPKEQATYPSDIHSDQQFWGMPRRIFLTENNLSQPEACDLCGRNTKRVYCYFKNKNYGINFKGTYAYPLSPHDIKADGESIPVHPQPGGFGYRHWLGYIENSKGKNSERRPARVINQFRSLRSSDRKDGILWAFGYDMDKMKARCWYDAKMPILIINEKQKDTFRGYAEKLIQSADWIADNLNKKIKKALFGEAEIRGNMAFIKSLFWQQTENVFYQTMYQLRDALSTNQPITEIILSWRNKISQEAIAIFDEKSQTGDFDAVNSGRVACARNELSAIIYGDKLKDILGLPKDKTKKKKR